MDISTSNISYMDDDIPNELNCEYHIPPDFRYHILQWNAPSEYYFFWPIAGIATLISTILTVPRVYQFHKAGKALQNKDEKVFMPPAFRACSIIIGFPFVISICKLYVLFVPIGENAIEFISKGYEGICLFVFALLIVMFLGGRNNFKKNISNATPSKYWVTLPLCCFCGIFPCCKEKTMDVYDFGIAYRLVMQFAVLAPIFSAIYLLRSFENEKSPISYAFKILGFASVLLCLWALFAMLKATDSILHSYNIHGKFWSIKMAVFILIFTPIIISLFDIKSYDYFYTKHVMIEAWSSMVICVLLVPLSIMMVKYYKVNDAYNANQNMITGNIIGFHKKEKINDNDINQTEIQELNNNNDINDNNQSTNNQAEL